MIVTTESFQADVLQANGLVIVDFWAEWCGPCKIMTPILEGIAKEKNVTLATVDVGKEPKLAEAMDIFSIPTIMIYKNGKIKETFIGVTPKAKVETAIDQVV